MDQPSALGYSGHATAIPDCGPLPCCGGSGFSKRHDFACDRDCTGGARSFATLAP